MKKSVAVVFACALLASGQPAGAEIDSIKGASPAVGLATGLTLMRGHLRSAAELAKGGNIDQAKLHFHHPAGEIYADIAAELDGRKVGFAAELTALEGAGADGWSPALDAVLAAIGKAEATIDAGEAGSPAFVTDVTSRVLSEAAGEYAAAFPSGQPVNGEEYQDSRGFVLAVGDMIAVARTRLAEKDATAASALEATVAELLKAWPSIEPPAAPVVAVADVEGLVAKYKESAVALTK